MFVFFLFVVVVVVFFCCFFFFFFFFFLFQAVVFSCLLLFRNDIQTDKLKILRSFGFKNIIDIPDKIDKNSSVLVNNFKFVWTNYLGLAADRKIHVICH